MPSRPSNPKSKLLRERKRIALNKPDSHTVKVMSELRERKYNILGEIVEEAGKHKGDLYCSQNEARWKSIKDLQENIVRLKKKYSWEGIAFE